MVLNFAILPSLQQFNKLPWLRSPYADDRCCTGGRHAVSRRLRFAGEIYRELGISLHTNEAAEEAGSRWAQHYEFLSQIGDGAAISGPDGSAR